MEASQASGQHLRYPIGEFHWEGAASYAQREHWIQEIEEAPARLRAAVEGLSDAQLDTPYRLGGWTVRQVVHHLGDSHMNAYVRFKLALTENEPTVKTYDQERWAELADARSEPAETSLVLLESLHRRWVAFLRSLTAEEFARSFHHLELGVVTLDRNLASYAWHGRHHVAQITSLRKRLGWGEQHAAGSH